MEDIMVIYFLVFCFSLQLMLRPFSPSNLLVYALFMSLFHRTPALIGRSSILRKQPPTSLLKRRVVAQFSSTTSPSTPDVYDFKEVEERWQKYWDDNQTFKTVR